jgi:predicted nuclease of predicted toxin-antitoxin system
MRFHLDEHIPPAVADALRRRGIDVTTTLGAGLQGVADIVQLRFATSGKRVLLTADTDFLMIAAAGEVHAGIVLFRPVHRTIGQLIECLLLVHACLTEDNMTNHIEFC